MITWTDLAYADFLSLLVADVSEYTSFLSSLICV